MAIGGEGSGNRFRLRVLWMCRAALVVCLISRLIQFWSVFCIMKKPLKKMFPFLSWKSEVKKETVRKDLLAGLIGAVIVLPQGVAFATIAGLPPEYGLYSAIIPAIVAALWGSSWHLVSGPTTAISLVVFASLSPLAAAGSPEYVSLAITLSFLVGLIQLFMGWMQLGSLVNFISHTVVIGFTAGAGILIASNQVKNFFGIPVPQGSSFYETWEYFFSNLGAANGYVALIGIVTLLVGVLFKVRFRKIPYMIPAILVGSLLGFFLNQHFGQEVTGIRTIGSLPSSLPPFSLPRVDIETFGLLASSALAITLLALTEAVAIARAVGLKSGQHIEGNQEFIGQGLSNIAGSFFSAYPSSGSFNRSGLNFEAGAKTPLASVFASIFLAVIVLFVAPLAAYLPLAVMASVLFLVAWGLIDFHHMRSIVRASRSEGILLFVTFISTLFIELEFAVFIGILLSLALYLRRASHPAVLRYVPDPKHPKQKFSSSDTLLACPQLEIVRLDGALFFGSVEHVESELLRLEAEGKGRKFLLLVCTGISSIDLSGADMLMNKAKRLRKVGGDLYLSNVNPSVLNILENGGYLDVLGKANVFSSKHEALASIVRKKLDGDICGTCEIRIFHECPARV